MSRNIYDLPYASQSGDQKLDILLPEAGEGPFPVIVWLHPGGFTGGDKEMIAAFSGAMLDRGYAAVSVNYRLAGDAVFPAQIFDARAAVRWVRANAGKYHFDPARVAAWGVSAGSSLAALLGTAGGVKELEDLSMGNPGESGRVDAVVSFFGPMDFVAFEQTQGQAAPPEMAGQAASGEELLMGGSLESVPDIYRAASASTWVGPGCPPFYIQHGTADDVVPCQQSISFAAQLRQAIGQDKVVLRLIEKAGHFDRVHCSDENLSAALDFLDRHLI